MSTDTRRWFFTHLDYWRLIRIRFVTDEEVRAGMTIRPLFALDEHHRWDCRAALAALRMIISCSDFWPSGQRYESACYLEEKQELIVSSGLPPLARCRRGDVIQEGNVG